MVLFVLYFTNILKANNQLLLSRVRPVCSPIVAMVSCEFNGGCTGSCTGSCTGLYGPLYLHYQLILGFNGDSRLDPAVEW